MPTINRRNVIKTMALAGSATAIPMAAQALGKNLFDNVAADSTGLNPLPLYVDVKLGQTSAKQQTQIINHGDKPLTVTGFNPSTFTSVNGQVTVNLKTPKLPYTLQPGESIPVYAEAVSPNSLRKSLPVVPTIASESIAIRTEHASVSGELFVTVFDSQSA